MSTTTGRNGPPRKRNPAPTELTSGARRTEPPHSGNPANTGAARRCAEWGVRLGGGKRSHAATNTCNGWPLSLLLERLFAVPGTPGPPVSVGGLPPAVDELLALVGGPPPHLK